MREKNLNFDRAKIFKFFQDKKYAKISKISKSILKNSIIFVLTFIIFSIFLNIGKNQLQKNNATIKITPVLSNMDVIFPETKKIWYANFSETVADIHRQISDYNFENQKYSNLSEEIVMTKLIRENTNFEVEENVSNLFKDINFWIDPDKTEFFRLEMNNTNSQSLDYVSNIIFETFKNIIKKNLELKIKKNKKFF